MKKPAIHSSKSTLIICILLLFILSCKNDNSKDSMKDASLYFINFFTGNDEAVLRDVSFNISSDELMKIEKSKLYEATPDHLFYEFSYPTDSSAFSEYANIQYFFNEDNQLDIITTEIFLNDSIQESKLKNSIIEYYHLRFGKPEKDDYEQDIWKGSFLDEKTSKNYNYSVALKELNGEYGIALEYVRE